MTDETVRFYCKSESFVDVKSLKHIVHLSASWEKRSCIVDYGITMSESKLATRTRKWIGPNVFICRCLFYEPWMIAHTNILQMI